MIIKNKSRKSSIKKFLSQDKIFCPTESYYPQKIISFVILKIKGVEFFTDKFFYYSHPKTNCIFKTFRGKVNFQISYYVRVLDCERVNLQSKSFFPWSKYFVQQNLIIQKDFFPLKVLKMQFCLLAETDKN